MTLQSSDAVGWATQGIASGLLADGVQTHQRHIITTQPKTNLQTQTWLPNF